MPGKPLPDAVYRGNDLRHEDKHVLSSALLSAGWISARASRAQGNGEMATRHFPHGLSNSRFFLVKVGRTLAAEIAVFADVLSGAGSQ